MSQSRHDQTQRNVFYNGHPPACTCTDCQSKRWYRFSDSYRRASNQLRQARAILLLVVVGALLVAVAPLVLRH